jgi:hypothetical protein
MSDHDEVMRSGAGAEAGRIPLEGPGYARIAWQHVPSCPCFRCEDFRRDNGLSCMYGLGPRPEEPPRHNWRGQAMFAGLDVIAQLNSPDSAPETGSES